MVCKGVNITPLSFLKRQSELLNPYRASLIFSSHKQEKAGNKIKPALSRSLLSPYLAPCYIITN